MLSGFGSPADGSAGVVILNGVKDLGTRIRWRRSPTEKLRRVMTAAEIPRFARNDIAQPLFTDS
ncbi:MAG: hypothetical protein ACO1SX_02860 [Actinomycetota bacterium]